MKALFFAGSMLLAATAGAQFAPQVLISGSTAISRNSPQFSAWASGCSIFRGLQQIGNPALGYAAVGDSTMAAGPADGTVVSLGDSGVAVLRFATPVRNEEGPDFAVFENGFVKTGDPELAFLELAFVEVSSDGINFVRFPATSQTPDTEQISSIGGMSYISARRINNLAGKYIGTWGTPFDLAELAGSPGLNVNAITHVRIVDVIGDIGAHASRDAQGNIVNDPFPTDFPSGGFDLDAVGVLNASATGVRSFGSAGIAAYPNPAGAVLNIRVDNPDAFRGGRVLDLSGREVLRFSLAGRSTSLSTAQLPAGCYYLQLTGNDGMPCTQPFVHQ